MTVQEFLTAATKQLQAGGIGTARLDTLVLLEDCLGTDRASLLAHPDTKLSTTHAKKLQKQIDRRLEHIPLAYIRGKTEFYGREFVVNENVLEPRPESETMIDLFKKIVHGQKNLRLADVGSGSGCLGITAALEVPIKNIVCIDNDPKTLQVAAKNATKYGVTIKCLQNDLLDGDCGPFDVLLANLPYVPDSFHINQAAMREPSHAIFGGQDGLDLYRRLFDQLSNKNWRPKYIFAESLPPQHEKLTSIASLYNFTCIEDEDFIQVFSSAA